MVMPRSSVANDAQVTYQVGCMIRQTQSVRSGHEATAMECTPEYTRSPIASGTAELSTSALEAVVIHNHPIHYKHLLFKAMAASGLRFRVLFTAGASTQRLDAAAREHADYDYRISYQGSYEEAPALAALSGVWRGLEEARPQVVIISGYYDAAAWAAWLWSLIRHRPIVLWAESNAFDYSRVWWKEAVKSVFVSRCDIAHVYGVSNAAYMRQLGMSASRILVKRAVADTNLFVPQPEQSARDRRRLLFVGRFEEMKNLERLVRAFARRDRSAMPKPMELILVGYGRLQQRLESLIEELSVGDCVRIHGKAQQHELPAIYATADAFVLPSTREAWGLVVLEAMLCGKPVLVSNRCGCALDLVNAGTGWAFDPHSETAICDAINQFGAASDTTLRDMGSHARQTGMQYTPENCARVIADSVRRLVRREGPRLTLQC
jgi:glycosyltransferase involved in cell wall biosynthesis